MSAEANKPNSQVAGRGALIGLAALFFVPLMGAFWLYYAGGWRPASSTNHGELITPARPLGAVSLVNADGSGARKDLLAGKWTLVYIGDGACTETCRKALWTIRQTRLLLAEDMNRVHRVFIADGNCCDRAFLDREHPGLETVTIDATTSDAAASNDWLAQFPREDARHFVYVVDPLGNLMMRFDITQNPKGLLQDLEKLLKLSHIG